MLRRLLSGRPVKKTSFYGAIKPHSGFPYGEKPLIIYDFVPHWPKKRCRRHCLQTKPVKSTALAMRAKLVQGPPETGAKGQAFWAKEAPAKIRVFPRGQKFGQRVRRQKR